MFKPSGIYALEHDHPIVLFEEATCQIVVGLKDTSCVKA